jgi:hypothetical protein
MNPDTTNDVAMLREENQKLRDIIDEIIPHPKIREVTLEDKSKLDNVLKRLISEDKHYK